MSRPEKHRQCRQQQDRPQTLEGKEMAMKGGDWGEGGLAAALPSCGVPPCPMAAGAGTRHAGRLVSLIVSLMVFLHPHTSRSEPPVIVGACSPARQCGVARDRKDGAPVHALHPQHAPSNGIESPALRNAQTRHPQPRPNNAHAAHRHKKHAAANTHLAGACRTAYRRDCQLK